MKHSYPIFRHLLLLLSVCTFGGRLLANNNPNLSFDVAVSISVTNGGVITCNVPTVTLSAVSATANLSYSWIGPHGFTSTSQSVVVSTEGNYRVVATGPDGTADANFEVTKNTTSGSMSWTLSGPITCNTPKAYITVNALPTPVSYSWTGPNGFSSTAPQVAVNQGGNYTVTATFSVTGCTLTKTFAVAENKTIPVVTLNNPGTLSCANPTVTLSASSTTPNLSFLWIGDDFFAEGTTAVVSNPGQYILSATNPANGCINTIVTEVTGDNSNCGRRVTTTAGIQNNPAVTKFTYAAYPNPVIANSAIQFASPENTQVTVSLYNTLGVCEKVLFKGNAAAGQQYRLPISATQLAAGAHYYIINTGARSYTGKLMIVK